MKKEHQGSADFIVGSGEMANLIRRTDWSRTPLGPMAGWPQSLRTTVSLCLASNFPINIIWGPEHTQIYNDGYRALCGEAHPRALGEAYDVTWASAWPAVGEPFARALAGETSFLENQRMFLTRNGYLEETFFTFSLSPIRAEDGSIGGLFHPVTETTATMLAERRTRALRDLSSALDVLTESHGLQAAVLQALQPFAFDLPVLLIYELDEQGQCYALAAQQGLSTPAQGELARFAADADGPWGTREMLRTHGMSLLDALPASLATQPCGPYAEPPSRAVLLPIVLPGSAQAPMLLVVAPSPRLPFDEGYRGFLQLLASSVAGLLASVRASTFRSTTDRAGLSLQIATDLPDAPPAPEAVEALDAVEPGARGGRVLLADDNADMRGYVARLLAAQGIEVTTAVDGEEALAKARTRVPDLVLSDAMMPRLDGFGLLAALRADAALRDVPVMLLSARAGQEARVEGLAAGADDYLTKPFSARELVARVCANLRLNRERRRAAAAVAQSEARLRTIFEASYLFQGLVAADGRLLDANPSALAAIAQPLSAVADRPLWDTPWFVGTPDMPQKVREAVQAAAAGQTLRSEIRLQLPVGGWREFDFTLRPVQDDAGRVMAIVFEAVEITDRKRMEAALREAQKLEAVGRLTGGVAHDFNNLMMVIAGGISVLERQPDAARQRQALDGMRRVVERGSALTRQLLTFGGSKRLAAQPIDLPACIDGMQKLLDRTLGGQVRVVSHYAAGLWPVLADPSELELVLLNLGVNARDAMPAGGTVSITAENARNPPGLPPGDFVRLCVSDTGAGMAPGVRQRAFEPFFTTKEFGKGSGVGLAQVYGFARESGGAAEIDSAQGRGTTVTLLLPRSPEPVPAPPASIVVPGPLTVTGTHRVLVVEDDSEVAELVAEMLEYMGYQTVRAISADEALFTLEHDSRIDLVFSDVMMPGTLNGVELARRMRRDRPDLPVILTTGYAESFRQEAHNEGLLLLPKPYAIEELGALMERAFQAKVH